MRILPIDEPKQLWLRRTVARVFQHRYKIECLPIGPLRTVEPIPNNIRDLALVRANEAKFRNDIIWIYDIVSARVRAVIKMRV